MDVNIGSIFDLTPPEKLQLVEDLWDDLAAFPESVPVHDWQKGNSSADSSKSAQLAQLMSQLA